MKKVISLLLVICSFISTFSFSANAKYDKDILFNDIPWETSYKETIKILSEKYGVEFSEPEFSTAYELWDTVNNARNYGEIPFSTYTYFNVHSLSTAKVAGCPAIIRLGFYFDNDGHEIYNSKNDVDTAVLAYAKYVFSTHDVAEEYKKVYKVETFNKISSELKLKIGALYGEEDEYVFPESIYYGKDGNTKLEFSHGNGELYIAYDDVRDATGKQSIELLKVKIQNWAEQSKENKEKEQARKEEAIRNGDKSGL